ncbi:MAG: hypothetical protein NTW96_15770 [Planctomycetia bacterium]|nr:hypothetical protein [Planctomycetia bacterium]
MGVANVVVMAVVAIGIGAVGVNAPTNAGEPKADKPMLGTPEQQERLDLMKSRATEASLTILPVRLGGKPWDRVTEVVGLLLEQQGLRNIELSKAAFEPAAKTDLQGLAASVGEFGKGRPITTEYVLYAEINGSPETGVNELRAVVADKAGRVVWTDRQTPRDEAFQGLQSREPMSLCVLLVQRLSPQLGLNEETAKAAKPGKMAAIMDQRSGMPPESDRTPLAERQKQMKQLGQNATVMVLPVRVRMADNAAEAGSAADLAKMISDAGLCKATPAKQSLLLEASQADPNEMKVLWDLAREFRDYSRKNPHDADYVLYADYRFSPQQWQAGFVHFVVCDRKGEWVIVDMQNSHHPDYQSIRPTSKEGCDKLLLKRLEGYLR